MALVASLLVYCLVAFALPKIFPLEILEYIYLIELLVFLIWVGYIRSMDNRHHITHFLNDNEFAREIHEKFCWTSTVSVPIVAFSVFFEGFPNVLSLYITLLLVTGSLCIGSILLNCNLGGGDDDGCAA